MGTRNPDVDAWFERYANPMKETVAAARVLFHEGATIPGAHPILEGGGDHARYARIAGPEELAARRAELEAVVRAWCDARDAGE